MTHNSQYCHGFDFESDDENSKFENKKFEKFEKFEFLGKLKIFNKLYKFPKNF